MSTPNPAMTRVYPQSWPQQPVVQRDLPVTAERHAQLRAQLREDRADLTGSDPSRRDAAIDRALQFAYIHQLGMPTAKRLLGEVGVPAADVDRVAGERANNPRSTHPDRMQHGSLGGPATAKMMGVVSEPVTRVLPRG